MLYCPGYKNEVGKINVVCEGFVISETHDAYTFVLDSLFKMCPLRGRKDIHAVFSDEFMTQSILDSIGNWSGMTVGERTFNPSL